MGYSVPMISIGGMFFSLILSICVPVILFLIWRKKTQASYKSLLMGMVIFIVFAMVIEQAFHAVVLKLTGELITGNVWLLALYGGLCAGLFEETGRFIAMKGVLRPILNRKNAIMYGIGHGGIEAILLVGISYISNIAMAFAINNNSLPASLDLSDETLFAQISGLWTTPAWMFYLAGLERLCAIFLHIVFSYMIYKAVKGRDKKWFVIAVLVHMAVDTGTVLLNSVCPTYVVEIILLVAMILLVCWTVKDYGKEEVEAPAVEDAVQTDANN